MAQEAMDTELASLPSEVATAVREYRRVLQAVQYRTPLQRANQIVGRKNAIALAHRKQSEAERVFNLLAPGHSTQLSVDFFRLLFRGGVALTIPVTLVSNGEGVVLLQTNESKQVTSQLFPDLLSALPSFLSGLSAAQPRPLPQFVHKASHSPCSFHLSLETAIPAWTAAVHSPQRLQEFVVPRGPSISLLRVYWRKDRKPVHYLVAQGKAPYQSLSTAAHKTRLIDRSFSEPFLMESRCRVDPSIAHLTVQRLKLVPDVSTALKTCAQVIEGSLAAGKELREMVCDFVGSWKGEWVFIGCQGFTHRSKFKGKMKIIVPNEAVTLQSLMFPLVTRKSLVYTRIRKSQAVSRDEDIPQTDTLPAHPDSHKRHLASYSVSQSCFDSPMRSAVSKPTFPGKRDCNAAAKSTLASGVRQYDCMLEKSRAYKEEVHSKEDFVEKYGGVHVWRRKLRDFMAFASKLPQVANIFLENIGFEETDTIVCGLLRVLRGRYNFYYKDSLKHFHHRKCILPSQYALFLAGIEGVFLELTQSESESQAIVQRFQQFQQCICRPDTPV